MPLPAPNLDDRRFQDFVDDAKRLLQRRIPAWSDHNVHDPGVTLIEAVATIADQLSYRLNQVPERHHRKFLDLLGITLRPPSAARTELTFRLSAARPEPVVVPTSTIVSTRRSPADAPISFTTLNELVIVSTSLAELRAAPAVSDDPSAQRDLNADITAGRPGQCFSTPPRPGDQVYVGLSTAAPNCVILLRVEATIEGIGVDPERPPLQWEAHTPSGWQPCELESDGTGGLNRAGDIVMHLPDGHDSSLLNGVRAAWLRAIVTQPSAGVPAYSSSPVITRMVASCVGGTASAIHADFVASDVLGTAEGSPGQHFVASRHPMLPNPDPVLEVADSQSEDGWQRWTRVEDFSDSGRDDPHYVLDAAAGVVEFGPAVRLADGSVRSYGMTPPETAVVRLRDYWAGGGAVGNVAAGTLTVLRASIPFVKSVANRRPAVGGRDGESIEEAKVRAPRALRTRDRAVCAEDFELIAAESAGAAVRVRCIAPSTPAEPIRLLVVPDISGYGPGRVPFPALVPADGVLRAITAALDRRRLVGVRIVVEPPRYQGITVAVRLRPRRGVAPEILRETARAALYRWLHPWLGGPDSSGWAFGRTVTVGDVHAALVDVEGVDYVDEARLYAADPTSGARGESVQRVDIAADMLPFSYDHQVQVLS